MWISFLQICWDLFKSRFFWNGCQFIPFWSQKLFVFLFFLLFWWKPEKRTENHQKRLKEGSKQHVFLFSWKIPRQILKQRIKTRLFQWNVLDWMKEIWIRHQFFCILQSTWQKVKREILQNDIMLKRTVRRWDMNVKFVSFILFFFIFSKKIKFLEKTWQQTTFHTIMTIIFSMTFSKIK